MKPTVLSPMTLREDFFCTVTFFIPKMGYKIMSFLGPKSLLSASPRQHFFWSLVFYRPTGSPQSNPLRAGPEVLHFYACQLHEWIKVSREDSIRETLGHSQEQRCKLKKRMGLEDPSDSVIWRDGMCSFSALNQIGLSYCEVWGLFVPFIFWSHHYEEPPQRILGAYD